MGIIIRKGVDMSHYTIIVVVKGNMDDLKSVEKSVSIALAPFREKGNDYNQNERWSHYSFGGRWDGMMTGKHEGFEGGKHHSFPDGTVLKDNVCLVSNIAKDFIPYAVLTPDGIWCERGKVVGLGEVDGVEKDSDLWGKEVKAVLKKFRDKKYVSVLCDLYS